MATTTQNKELQDQAASAALKVTGGSKSNKSNYPLDSDKKLSSASAATSLKRANPKDLPSFPSRGIADSQASAGAAASLAFAEQKPFEHWKPELSQPAGKAALLAHDSKPPEFWQPEASKAGSKAAMLAHKNTVPVNLWTPDPSAEGNSAAGLAMQGKGKPEDAQQKTYSPAFGSTRRRRADSNPVSYVYPDSTNSARNALKAATMANAPKATEASGYNDLPGFSQEDAARIHKAATTNMDRSMYTSAPPVAPEVEEKNRKAALRASAISMAKNMMAAQERAAQSHENELQAAAKASNDNKGSIEADRREAAIQYLNLQDAAKKLAAERLAKISDESEEYRKYYGAFAPTKSRMSLRSRRRSFNDASNDPSDRARSEKIKNEMNLFNSKIAEVDKKKRQNDRDALMAAAQRNVEKNIKGMDERVFLETGKASPAMKAQWEASARERAEKDSKLRMENYGKIHIGGGTYMYQEDVDAIARGRVQPTLDEVTRKAEAQRALDEQRRQEAEERARIAELKALEEKERNQETNMKWNRFKASEKEEKRKQKEEEKKRKEEAEFKRVFETTDQERDRKAREAKLAEEQAIIDADEKERAAEVERRWQATKEAERKEKEEEKARKTQDKRKSRIGSILGSISLGHKDKKDEARESKGKAAAVTIETTKLEPVTVEEPSIATGEPSTTAAPVFTSAAVEEAFRKINGEEEVKSSDPISTELPESKEDRLQLAEKIYVPTDLKPEESRTTIDTEEDNSKLAQIEAAYVPSDIKVKQEDSEVDISSAPAPVVSSKSKTPSTSPSKAKDDSRQSWFKRKFSRSAKEDRPQPGTITKMKRGQEESKSEDIKGKSREVSAPVPAIEESTADNSGAAAIAAASALPSHISSTGVHRSDTDTNLSERDVALAGKEEQSTHHRQETTDEANQTTSASVSSLSDKTPTGSMRGVASAALAASSHLDAQEALRQEDSKPTLTHVDTTDSQDMFEEARDGLEDLNPSEAGTGTGAVVGTRSVSSTSGSAANAEQRKSVFHEEL